MPKKNIAAIEKRNVPVRREEYHPFSLLRQEMNTLFDNFFRGFELEPFKGHLGAFSPCIDVKESEKDISVTAELPGLDEKDIDVSLSRDSLTIRGEKKEEKEEKEQQRNRGEEADPPGNRSGLDPLRHGNADVEPGDEIPIRPHFVCDGEYARGLERILKAYLDGLNREEQKAVWVSGFFGSGKSHTRQNAAVPLGGLSLS